jgi:hypothetical protein
VGNERIVVDSIAPMTVRDITYDLARESGFESVDDLLRIAKHGSGEVVYLIGSIIYRRAPGTRQGRDSARSWLRGRDEC